MQRFLIIRFSSIGDIVLTTPVVRCLKKAYPDAEIHYLTKKSFASVVDSNPNIHKVWTIDKEVDEVLDTLSTINFRYVLDLHKNLRSKKVVRRLGKPSASFDKLNVKKWLLTNFKVNKMPNVHIVDRYFQAGKEIGLKNDQEGLDFFVNAKDEVPKDFEQYAVFVVGAAHATKALSLNKSVEVINKINLPVVLVGGPNDHDKAKKIAHLCGEQKSIKNLAGELSLGQSASVIAQSAVVITPDTGMMHIASALKKPIVSIWGNTVPEFGMYPYIPNNKELVSIVEVKDLSCRPCSKIGYEKCPKKHFKCIEEINADDVAQAVQRFVG